MQLQPGDAPERGFTPKLPGKNLLKDLDLCLDTSQCVWDLRQCKHTLLLDVMRFKTMSYSMVNCEY